MNHKKIIGTVGKIILGSVGVAGLFLIAATVPNIVNVLPRKSFKNYSKGTLDGTTRRLLRRGLIKFTQGRNGWKLELTEKGLEFLESISIVEELKKRKNKKWDGKWHLLIFDIPEKNRRVRDDLRQELIKFEFYRLQDSVWVYPHECEDILELLRTKYGVRYDALYICAQKIAKDEWLRRHFKLSS